MSKSSLNDPPQIRRRIRWGRVMIIIILPVFVIASFGVCAFYQQKPNDKLPVVAANQPEVLKNQLNILVLGLDDGHSNELGDYFRKSDALVVVNINPDEANIKLLSIPCNTLAYIPGKKEPEKINNAYTYGGVELAKATVEELLKIPIQHYVAMDGQAFVKIVDSLGGIDLYVENNMHYQDTYADLNINLKKGYQCLDGLKASQYVRFRSDELGDIGRVQRQQRFLKAMLQETTSLGAIFKLPALASTVNQFVDTDMPVLTMVKVANTLKKFKMDAVKTEILPGEFAAIDNLSCWKINEEQVQQTVNRMFYSTNSPITVVTPEKLN